MVAIMNDNINTRIVKRIYYKYDKIYKKLLINKQIKESLNIME